MAVKNYEGTDIDVCENCGSVWLDKGELGKIINTKEVRFSLAQMEEAIKLSAVEHQARTALLKDIKSFKRDINIEELDNDQILRIFKKRWSIDRKLSCPKCTGMLEESDYSGVGVIIDKCPVGCGFWLDKGELDKVQIMMEYYNKAVASMKESEKSKLGLFDVISNIVKEIIPF